MKINKTFSFFNQPAHNASKIVPNYNPENVTRKEFRNFVHYLAENKINKTFIEPKKFTTEPERLERKRFREWVHYLAENGINHTFIC